MKIFEQNSEQKRFQDTLSSHLNHIWRHWLFQALLVFATFFAGMLVYRAGILRPIYAGLKTILIEGVDAVNLPGPVEEVKSNLVSEVRLYVNNGLPTLYIDLPFESYEKLRAKRNEALEVGILLSSDEDYVPAKVQLQDGPKLQVEMRLKGDWTDHLQANKWSYRIQLKEDGHFFHMKEFSIQSPETREYLREWAFHQNLMQEGVLTTRYEFVNVLQNGTLLGIYAMEESFAPQLIESQGRRQGVIIRFDEDLMWQNMANFWKVNIPTAGSFMVTNQASADISPFKPSRIARDPVLAVQAETAIGLLRSYQLGERKAGEVFDLELMGRFFALSDLWSACHGTAWHNMRFYYNPITGLLEPVAFDAEPFRWCDQQNTIINEFIGTSLFNDPEIRQAYVQELARVADPVYVETFRNGIIEQHERLVTALRTEYATEDIDVPWDKLRSRSISLRQELQPPIPVRAAYYLSGGETYPNEGAVLNLELINLMVLPVELVRVEVNGHAYVLAPSSPKLPMVNRPDEQVFIPNQLSVPLAQAIETLNGELDVSVIVRLAGLKEEIAVQASGVKMPESLLVGPMPVQPSFQQALSQHSFLAALNDQTDLMLVAKGDWRVNGDLILPAGVDLYVPAGTSLRFEPGAILYTNGALHLLGTKNEPVIVTAQNQTAGWGGVVVLKAKNGSTWKNAYVERTTGINRDGWILTGGITFFQSDIILDETFIGKNSTEDAINVVHSKFIFRNAEFANTLSDAFDSDFSTGEITNCYFYDIAGDAIDISGTQVTIADTQIEKIGDKGISVGEESIVTVRGVSMKTVGIGIASKDLSKVYVTQTEIIDARYAALAAYIKKPVYGPALIEATDIVITNTPEEAIVQTGSEILLRGKIVKTIDMDVDRLYAEQILGN